MPSHITTQQYYVTLKVFKLENTKYPDTNWLFSSQTYIRVRQGLGPNNKTSNGKIPF